MANKKNKQGCGKNAFWNGSKMIKCGEPQFESIPEDIIYCKDCKLKNLGVIVGKKFYEISYGYGRWVYEYEVLKINDKSVRIRCIFLDGRQKPQEYAITKDKALDRFERYCKTFKGAINSSIKANKKGIEDAKKMIKHLPKQIKICETEIDELKKLNLNKLQIVKE